MEDLKKQARKANSPPLTPIGFLERTATVYGESTSLVYRERRYTWSETHSRCLRLASSIYSLLNNNNNNNNNLRIFPVVSVIAPNVPALYELHFGVPMAGAVLNNLNTRLDHRTVSVLLRHSGSRILFADVESIPLAVKALSLFPEGQGRPILIQISSEFSDVDDNTNTNSNSYYSSSDSNPNSYSSNYYYYEGLISNGDPSFRWIRPQSEWDPIVLNYTSGTTSSPKGVVHSHRGAFLITLDSLINWPLLPASQSTSSSSSCVYLWTLPMFHANGWSFTWGTAAVGAVGICLRKVEPDSVFDAIKRHGVTHMCGAPVVLNMLVNNSSSSSSSSNKSNPVHVMTAGAPPPAPILLRAEEMGFVVSHGYGLTETGGLVVTCAWKDKWNKYPATQRARLKARQGVRTIGMTEIDVIDPETFIPVKRDGQTVGEVVLRGGCLMLGYLNDPEATSSSMMKNIPDSDDYDSSNYHGWWFRTGDVGVMHPDGYLEIKDRSKDIIISGGENISSVEVESVLYTHPDVQEAAVVARPDDYWGETPCAFLTLKNTNTNNISPDLIIDYCRSKMPHYMVPKTIVFKDELPKTSTGKIQKFLLREIAKSMSSSSSSSSSSSFPTKTTSRL